MRKLWKCEPEIVKQYSMSRKGVRLRFDKNVHIDVRKSCIQFVRWLKTEYIFPMRVVIYFKGSEKVKSILGESASATFWGPYDTRREPHIKIAVGDYEELLKECGRDNALAAILCSIAHELSHYFQWLKNHNEWSKASEKTKKLQERQAIYYAREIVLDYAEVVEHP